MHASSSGKHAVFHSWPDARLLLVSARQFQIDAPHPLHVKVLGSERAREMVVAEDETHRRVRARHPQGSVEKRRRCPCQHALGPRTGPRYGRRRHVTDVVTVGDTERKELDRSLLITLASRPPRRLGALALDAGRSHINPRVETETQA